MKIKVMAFGIILLNIINSNRANPVKLPSAEILNARLEYYEKYIPNFVDKMANKEMEPIDVTKSIRTSIDIINKKCKEKEHLIICI